MRYRAEYEPTHALACGILPAPFGALDDDGVNELTRILQLPERDQGQVADQLLTVVYGELRKLAAAKLAQEPPGQTLQATALVHEAWLRLTVAEIRTWQNQAHFFGAAAEAMRRILVERARRKRRLRHGGGQHRVEWPDAGIAAPGDEERVLQVHEALAELAAQDPKEAEVVKLRFFVGLEHAEIARILGTSERTIKRYWAHAKAWLYRRIQEA